MKNFVFLFIFIISSSLCFGQWKALNTGTNSPYYDLHCIDENIVFACGQNGRIIKTDNGGDEWRECFSMTSQVNLLKIVFADENTGYAGGAGREVFRQTGINDSYITIYLTDWEAGMYIVKILTDRGFVSKKIIKQ